MRILDVILRAGSMTPITGSVRIQFLELVPGGGGLHLGEPVNDAALERERRRRRHARRTRGHYCPEQGKQIAVVGSIKLLENEAPARWPAWAIAVVTPKTLLFRDC